MSEPEPHLNETIYNFLLLFFSEYLKENSNNEFQELVDDSHNFVPFLKVIFPFFFYYLSFIVA